MLIEVTPAVVGDVGELADLAAQTFPLACPPSTTAQDIADFIAEHLTAQRFGEYLSDTDRLILTARLGTRMTGYTMLIRGVPDDADVQSAVTSRPAIELSKMYVLPEGHGAGISGALMAAAIDAARGLAASCIWLGVSQKNQRAQRFYAKQGFTVSGTKTFHLGGRIENDYVMVRLL